MGESTPLRSRGRACHRVAVGADVLEQGAGRAAVLAVSHRDERREQQAGDRDTDCRDARRREPRAARRVRRVLAARLDALRVRVPVKLGELALDVDRRVVRLETGAKLFAPGFRVGWLTASSALVACCCAATARLTCFTR